MNGTQTVKKVKLSVHASWHIGATEVQLRPFVTLALDRGKWSASCPDRFTPGERATPYPLNMRLGGPQNRSRRFGEEINLLSLRGFEPRFVHPVA
jgi:hypothetical protein